MPKQTSTLSLIEFECHSQRIGMPLEYVQRAIPSAAPSPLPGADAVVLGVLNLGGTLIAVLDLCYRLGLPQVPINPSQQIVILELPGFLCGVVVDQINGVVERAPDIAMPDGLDAAPFVQGMVRLDDGLCLIVDPARLLFPDEMQALAVALAGGADGMH
jgi:purine-binding chemotaxis protein CheW